MRRDYADDMEWYRETLQIPIRYRFSRCVHAAADIDFGKLKGRRIGILGHGAGAFDCAGMALAAGAASVDLRSAWAPIDAGD